MSDIKTVNKPLKTAIFNIKRDFGLKQSDIATQLGVKSTYLSDMINGGVPLTNSIINKIYELFQVKIELNEPIPEKNKIPFYDDIITVGGTSDMVAETSIAYRPAEYIDAGDWFKDATAALRHYGDSMIEYPSGCILAIKEVRDKSLLVWGKDYVIETAEYRITKRVQKGRKEGFITAYSSNVETYPDGRLIHEPLDISLDAARFSLVLGYVVKKNGGAMIYNTYK